MTHEEAWNTVVAGYETGVLLATSAAFLVVKQETLERYGVTSDAELDKLPEGLREFIVRLMQVGVEIVESRPEFAGRL